MLILCGVVMNTSVAWAAEQGLTVREGQEKISEIKGVELAALLRAEGNRAEIAQATRDTSYTVYRHTKAYDFYKGDLRIARAEIECIVWHYTDGKVHLYSRTITPSSISNYNIMRTYGQIVNTDGSLSYTSGDSIHIATYTESWDYAIEFRVTPSGHTFSCYEI